MQTNLVPAAYASSSTTMADISRSMTQGERGNFSKRRGNDGLTFSIEKNTRKVPDGVVEMIISRIPFPFIFKVRLLSRSWYFKFPLVPQFINSLTPYTQNLVSLASSKWPTYCPVYVTRCYGIVGFDRASARWKTLMKVSQSRLHWPSLTNAGPLIGGLKTGHEGWNFSLSVTSTLTGSWRNLNIYASTSDEVVALKIILQGSHAYKVLMVIRRKRSSFMISKVYDSASKGYYVDYVSKDVSSFRVYHASVFQDGNLYCLIANPIALAKVNLWIYNLEGDTWSTIPDRHLDGVNTIADCGVVSCGNKVMVVFCSMKNEDNEEVKVDDINEMEGFYTTEDSIHILELDLITLELKPVSVGPNQNIYGVGLQQGVMNFASDSDHIYFGQTCAGTAVLSYHIQSDNWDCLPPASYRDILTDSKWLSAAFQPGLSPFMMV